MSIDVNDLRLGAFYTLGVPFDMDRFRKLLRAQRTERVGGRDTLADLAGVNRTTIQNAEMGPDIPGIDTVAALIESMPGLRLSEFFRALETDALLPEEAEMKIPAHPPSPLASTEWPDADPDPALVERFSRDLAHAFLAVFTRPLAPGQRPDASAGAAKTSRRRRVRTRRRKAVKSG